MAGLTHLDRNSLFSAVKIFSRKISRHEILLHNIPRHHNQTKLGLYNQCEWGDITLHRRNVVIAL